MWLHVLCPPKFHVISPSINLFPLTPTLGTQRVLRLLTFISRTQNSPTSLLTPISVLQTFTHKAPPPPPSHNNAPPLPPPPPSTPPPHPNPHPRHLPHDNLPRHRHRLPIPHPRPRSQNLRLLRRSLQRRPRRPGAHRSKLRPSMGRAVQILLFDAQSAARGANGFF